MCSRAAIVSLLVLLCSTPVLFAQTSSSSSATSTSSTQATAALQSSLAALVGRATVNDVTLTGTVQWIAGSDDETGMATYKALPGANRLDMNFPTSGSHAEIRGTGTSGPSGAWTSPDGVSHSMAYHNLLTDPGIFPLFALSSISSSSTSLVTYIGPETRNGVSVIHLAASQQPTTSTGLDTALAQHLTQVDIYLDATTFLPVSYIFNIHPDNNALLDIPTEVRYSNYQNIGGAQIPLHVQKFINNTLTLDLQFQNASLNTGVTAAQIGAQ